MFKKIIGIAAATMVGFVAMTTVINADSVTLVVEEQLEKLYNVRGALNSHAPTQLGEVVSPLPLDYAPAPDFAAMSQSELNEYFQVTIEAQRMELLLLKKNQNELVSHAYEVDDLLRVVRWSSQLLVRLRIQDLTN